jgi:dienelactone hydrolase
MTEFSSDNYVPYLAEQIQRSYSFVARTEKEAREWQGRFRNHLVSLLGLDRIRERGLCDLAPEQRSAEELEDHYREEWTIQSEPDFRMPFFLLRPKENAGPSPLILTPHGHGKAGKATYAGIWSTEEERESIEEGERDIALQAVREGYVAIAPDVRAFAEMRTSPDKESDQTSSCDTLQRRALLFGRTLVGERVFDMGRLIDYAETRGEIDTARIAITGNSGGGTVTLFTAAVEPRIGMAIPGSYFCTFEGSIGTIRHCPCNYVPGIMCAGEMYDVAGLIAPRPFMAVTGREDEIFPYPAVEKAFSELKKIYHVMGASELCRLSTGEGGHRYYKRDVWPFVRECL